MTRYELKRVKKCVDDEVRSCEFYKETVNQLNDDEGKSFFEDLMIGKMNTINRFVELLGGDEAIKEMQIRWQTKNDTKKAYLKNLVFLCGVSIDSKKSLIANYKKLVDRFQDGEAKKLFNELIQIEQNNLEVLLIQSDYFKADWWMKQRYAPF